MDINKNIIVKENGSNTTGNMVTGDIESNMFLNTKAEDKVIIVPYKVPNEKYESIDEMIANREYIFDKAIEVKLK